MSCFYRIKCGSQPAWSSISGFKWFPAFCICMYLGAAVYIWDFIILCKEVLKSLRFIIKIRAYLKSWNLFFFSKRNYDISFFKIICFRACTSPVNICTGRNILLVKSCIHDVGWRFYVCTVVFFKQHWASLRSNVCCFAYFYCRFWHIFIRNNSYIACVIILVNVAIISFVEAEISSRVFFSNIACKLSPYFAVHWAFNGVFIRRAASKVNVNSVKICRRTHIRLSIIHRLCYSIRAHRQRGHAAHKSCHCAYRRNRFVDIFHHSSSSHYLLIYFPFINKKTASDTHRYQKAVSLKD